jgi:hypothetical protein
MTAKYNSRPATRTVDKGIRKVASTFGSVLFLTHNDKSNGTVAVNCESERIVSNFLGFDPSVHSFEPQPFKVDLIDRCLLRTQQECTDALRRHKDHLGPKTYTPDFLISRSNSTRQVIEVKHQAFLGDAEYDLKLSDAAGILYSNGYEFARVVIPSNSRDPIHSNAPLVRQAFMRKDLWPTPEVVERINQLAEQGASRVRDYLVPLQISANLIPIFLACGALSMDLVQHHINGESPVQPAFGSLDHLQLLERFIQ